MEIREIEINRLELKYEGVRVRRMAEERRLLVSLEEQGQRTPVGVVAGDEAGQYVVIDGHKRLRALKKLKADIVKAVIWEKPEAESLAAWYEGSRMQAWNAIEEGRLVEELYRSFGWSLTELGKRLSRSKSWVSRRLSLVEEMPEYLMAGVISGQVGAHAAVNYLLKLPRGNDLEGLELGRKICALSLSNRQIKEVCEHYKRAVPAIRKKITEDPLLFLKVRAQAASEGPNKEVERCVKNLGVMGNIALGLVRGIPEAWGVCDPEERKPLGLAWEKTLERWNLLVKTMSAVETAGVKGETKKEEVYAG